MDASTLYLVATLANGEHRLVRQVYLATNRECQTAAEWMPSGHIANGYLRAGAVRVWAYCAPWPKPLIIDRVPPTAG